MAATGILLAWLEACQNGITAALVAPGTDRVPRREAGFPSPDAAALWVTARAAELHATVEWLTAPPPRPRWSGAAAAPRP